MSERIFNTPEQLGNQCMMAAEGITAETDWPTTGPTAVDLGNAFSELTAKLRAVQDAEAALSQSRQTLKDEIAEARGLMKKVDNVTDGLYGPYNAKKEDYGIPPKKVPGSGGEPIVLDRIVITDIGSGKDHGTIAVNFKSVKGASYQAEWYADEDRTQLVGNMTLTESKFTARGLEAGKKYYFQIRAVKGKNAGPWSILAGQIVSS